MAPSQTPPSGTTLTAIRIISIARIFAGAACIFTPRFICALHGTDLPRELALTVRMMGIREGVVGGLLLTAASQDRVDGGIREIRRALWAGMVNDACDIASIAFGVATGELVDPLVGTLAAAAAGTIGLAAWVLNGL